LEREWAGYYNIEHAITVNSCTSGLYAAIGACGIGPGDEVIVSPYTMSASAACALIYNAIPVFADIEDKTFNLDPESIEERITRNTKAIVIIHIMGHPADMDSIMQVAGKYNLKVIEDCAQAHAAKYKDKYVGTIGDIGVFSLNVNKTIQTGEGGVLITNEDELAQRLRLIRNHGEVVADQMEYDNINNIIGYNYRMCEIEAAMGSEQLKKLESLNQVRVKLAEYLTDHLKELEGMVPPSVEPDCVHVFYVYSMKFKEDIVGIPRSLFCKALRAEGIPVYEGYVRPLYLQQLYQKRLGYGGKGCPFNCHMYDGDVDYRKGICPTAERMYEKELISLEIVKHPQVLDDMDKIVQGFKKVLSNIDNIKEESV
jgi:dTDP-4-amino-4,6-dideoxygalactose transaminase